jgi:hypothetical protein
MGLNAPPGAYGGGQPNYTGPGNDNPDLSGIVGPPNPLDDANAAVLRALSSMGVRATNMSPVAKAIRQKAGALVNELVLQAGKSGNTAMLSDASAMLSGLAQLIQRGVSGEKIFGQGGKSGLDMLASLAEKFQKGEDTSKGSGVLANLLSNPQNAEALYMQGMYGGSNTQTQSAMLGVLQDIVGKYQQSLEGNTQAQLAGGSTGLLRALLGMPPTSVLGAPTPITGEVPQGQFGGAAGQFGGPQVQGSPLAAPPTGAPSSFPGTGSFAPPYTPGGGQIPLGMIPGMQVPTPPQIGTQGYMPGLDPLAYLGYGGGY